MWVDAVDESEGRDGLVSPILNPLKLVCMCTQHYSLCLQIANNAKDR